MFPLFELARVLSLPKSSKGREGSDVKILKTSWNEAGERYSLALFLSTDVLLIASGNNDLPLITKQVSWYNNDPVTCMSYDPTGSWLLCTRQHKLCIVPSQKIIDPTCQVSGHWSTSDITQFKISKQRGEICACQWWQSWTGAQFAIIGTKLGYVMIISLHRGQRTVEVDVHDVVISISVVVDDRDTETSALITTQNGCQWKLFLEIRNDTELDSEDKLFLEEQGFEAISANKFSSIFQHTGEPPRQFRPVKYRFDSSVSLTAQIAKGRHFIAAHDSKSSLYQVYDSNVDHRPLFVFKIPPQTRQAILTDRLIFYTTFSEPSALAVLSNQLSEADEDQHEEVFSANAIIQQFELSPRERIKMVYKKSYPFYWHEKREASTDQIEQKAASGKHSISNVDISSHTVLDGCMVITNQGIYMCRPRISPERYFLELAVSHADTSIIEKLGISVGLDLHLLYRILAEHYLRMKNVSKSTKYMQLGKCDHLCRIKLLLQHGYIKEALSVLAQTDSSSESVSQHAELANITLLCYVQQVVATDRDSENMVEARANLREFLIGNFSFDKDKAFDLLAKHDLSDLLFEFAMERGLGKQALKVILRNGNMNLNEVFTKAVESQGLTSFIPRDSSEAHLGMMQNFLTEDTIIEVLSQDPNLATYLVSHLKRTVSDCHDENLLLWVVKIFDPSKQTMQDILSHLLKRNRSSRAGSSTSMESLNSLDSMVTASSENAQSDHLSMINNLVDFFLYSVILLNDRRPPRNPNMFSCEWNSSFEKEKPSHVINKLVHHHNLVACGSRHTAVISESQLYTWGAIGGGRLGFGDALLGPEYEHRPNRVQTFALLKLKVLSVSCGYHHSLALTDRGVYSWGCNQFGQLGINNRIDQSAPVNVPSLRDAMVVKVSCGQHHSLALTADCKVYSWGWGVHGQLGHGSIEDELEPRKISHLKSIEIVTIAGGQGHTLVCSKQGNIYSFGNNTFGQLGHGNEDKSSIPKQVELLNEPIKVISTQYFHNIAVSASGRVYSWGACPASYKQRVASIRQSRALGQPRPHSPLENLRRPLIVDTNMVQGRVVKVACGMNFSMLLTHDGEVYTWGSNNEAQLGRAAQHDMKFPGKVTKLNEQKITHLSAGPDFVVTMDTEAGLWVWGRNDSGQLALKPTKPVRRPVPDRTNTKGGRRVVQEPSCLVVIPNYIEPSRLSLQDSFELSGSLSSYRGRAFKRYIQLVPIEWWFENSGAKDHKKEFEIYDLEGDDPDVPYPVETVLQVYKELPQYCDVQAILQWCIDYKFWDICAHICQRLKQFPQALHYHLAYAKQNRKMFEIDDFSKTVIMLLEFYIRCFGPSLINETLLAKKKKMEGLIAMLHAVVDIYLDEKIPLDDIEEYIKENSDNLACPMFVVLTKLEADHGHRLHEKLNPSFFLHLTDAVYCLMDTDTFFETLLTDCGVIPATEIDLSSLQIKPPEKLIPTEKLWDDIMQNLNKGKETRPCINLSKQDVSSLVSSLDAGSGVEEESSVRLFTCGHHYPEKYFLENLLPEIESGLKHNGVPLQMTTSLLKNYYKRDEVQALACPRCVITALNT